MTFFLDEFRERYNINDYTHKKKFVNYLQKTQEKYKFYRDKSGKMY